MPKDSNNPFQLLGRYSYLAFILPVSTCVGYGIGYLLDKFFHTHFLYLVFLLLGIASGFIELIREVNRNESGK
jgi:F0F1-type ATP synthase assembly protein I